MNKVKCKDSFVSRLTSLAPAVAAIVLLAGCATEKKYAEFEPKGALAPSDPAAYASYGPAMAHCDGYQMAYEWQRANPKLVEDATKPEVLAKFVESPEAADELLAKIQAKLEELQNPPAPEERDEEEPAEDEQVEDVPSETDELPDDLDQLEELIDEIEGRKATIKAHAEKRSALISRIAQGNKGRKVRTFEDKKEEPRMYTVESKEYRAAFMKKLQGKPLDAEERAAVTATAAIPTETMNQIVHKLELNPLLAAVDMTHIPGYVTYPAEDTVNEASWVAMNTASTDSADVLAAVTLGAYKLIKTVEISADVEAMSIDAFETWLVDRLANKLEKAIDAGILNGGGSTSGECLGIKTSKSTQDYKYTKAAMTWKDLTAIMGKLPGQYHANASFVMPPALFFGEVLGMTDSTGNRVVVMDPQGERKFNVLGFPCIVDGNAATDEVYFGDLKAYKFNFAQDIEVRSSEEAEFRKGSKVWRGMCLADGKLADTNAIVRAIRST